MTVKTDTPRLHEALDALDWDRVPVQHAARESGHGRLAGHTGIAATIRKIRHSPSLLTGILGPPESSGNQS